MQGGKEHTWFARLAVAVFSCAIASGAAAAGRASTQDGQARGEQQLLEQRIDAIVEAAVGDGFAGGVAVLRGDRWIYTRVAGFSDASGVTPVRESTLFHVASIAKYFTAAMVLKAVEEGVLALGDSVDPLVAGTSLAGRGFTYQQLMAHRAGLGSSYAAEGKEESADALAAIAAVPWDAADIDQFKYSNDGYDLLGILLERAYARPYEELVREKLLMPAHLENARFWGEVDLADAAVVGQPLNRVPRPLRNRNYGMLGSGGLLITARDLARYQSALKRGLLLDRASSQALWAPRGTMSLGQATYGAFLIESSALGTVLSARGYEDWGDNAILNDYVDAGIIVAIVTSKGPAEGEGKPKPFRSRIAAAIERELATSTP